MNYTHIRGGIAGLHREGPLAQFSRRHTVLNGVSGTSFTAGHDMSEA